MKNGQNKIRAIAATQEHRNPRFSWVDLLVIAATIATFAAVLNTTVARAKAAPPDPSHLVSAQISQLPDDPDLIRARLRLATGL